MAYKFAKERKFRTPVNVTEPGMEPDKPVKSAFMATFKILTNARVKELAAGKTADEWDDGNIREALIDLDGIQDDGGHPVPFSPELVDDLLQHEPSRIALVNTYWQCVRTGKAKAGN